MKWNFWNHDQGVNCNFNIVSWTHFIICYGADFVIEHLYKLIICIFVSVPHTEKVFFQIYLNKVMVVYVIYCK